MDLLKMYLLWNMGIFHCYVSLLEGNSMDLCHRFVATSSLHWLSCSVGVSKVPGECRWYIWICLVCVCDFLTDSIPWYSSPWKKAHHLIRICLDFFPITLWKAKGRISYRKYQRRIASNKSVVKIGSGQLTLALCFTLPETNIAPESGWLEY